MRASSPVVGGDQRRAAGAQQAAKVSFGTTIFQQVSVWPGQPPFHICPTCLGVKLQGRQAVVQLFIPFALAATAAGLDTAADATQPAAEGALGVKIATAAGGVGGIRLGFQIEGAVAKGRQPGNEGQLCGGKQRLARTFSEPRTPRYAGCLHVGKKRSSGGRCRISRRMQRQATVASTLSPAHWPCKPTCVSVGGGACGIHARQQLLQAPGAGSHPHKLRRHLLSLGTCQRQARGQINCWQCTLQQQPSIGLCMTHSMTQPSHHHPAPTAAPGAVLAPTGDLPGAGLGGIEWHAQRHLTAPGQRVVGSHQHALASS